MAQYGRRMLRAGDCCSSNSSSSRQCRTSNSNSTEVCRVWCESLACFCFASIVQQAGLEQL